MLRLLFGALCLIVLCQNQAAANAQLNNISHLQQADYSRIVFEFSQAVNYQSVDYQADHTIVLKITDCFSSRYDEGVIPQIADQIVRSINLKKMFDKNLIFRINIMPEYCYTIQQSENSSCLIFEIYLKEKCETNQASPLFLKPASEQQQLKSTETNNPFVKSKVDNSNTTINASARVDKNQAHVANTYRQYFNSDAYSKSGKKQSQVSFIQIFIYAFIINSFIFMIFLSIRTKVQERKNQYKQVIPCSGPDSSDSEFKSLVQKNLAANKISTEKRDIKEKVNPLINQYRTTTVTDADTSINRALQDSLLRLSEEVERYLSENNDIKTIARQLNLGQDEIKMIINLNRKQRQNKAEPEKKSRLRFEFA